MKSKPLTKKQSKILLDHYDFVNSVVLAFCLRKGVANQYQIEDCQSAAILKTIDAIKRYDKSKGTSIKTWIWRKSISATKDFLRKELDFYPRDTNTKHLRAGLINPESIDDITNEDCKNLCERFGDELCNKDFSRKALSFLLSEGEAIWAHEFLLKRVRVFAMYFIDGLSMKEIGTREGLTETRIYQIIYYDCLPKIKEKFGG